MTAGAAICAQSVLEHERRRTLLDLDGMIRVEGALRDDTVRLTVTNVSGAPLQWSASGGAAAGAAPPGEHFELDADGADVPVCLQLAIAQTVGITIAVSLHGPSRRQVITQALVGS